MDTDDLRALGVTDFDIEELMPPPSLLRKRLWSAWHPQPAICKALQLVRDLVDAPVWCNTWAHGPGSFRERVVRPPRTSTGATYSQHIRGLAADFHVPSLTPKAVWEILHKHEADLMRVGVTTLESLEATSHDNGKRWGWIHMDCRYSTLGHLQIVHP